MNRTPDNKKPNRKKSERHYIRAKYAKAKFLMHKITKSKANEIYKISINRFWMPYSAGHKSIEVESFSGRKLKNHAQKSGSLPKLHHTQEDLTE